MDSKKFLALLPKKSDAQNKEKTAGKPEAVAWNDAYFKEKFMEPSKLSASISIIHAREYGKAFLNWYISGKGGGKLLDIWMGVISGVQVPVPASVCRIKLERLMLNTMYEGKVGDAVKLDPPSTVNKLGEFIYASQGIDFSSCEAKTWYNKIYEMLCSGGDSPNEMAMDMINYMGFLALTLLRLLVKDATKIAQHIIKSSTNDFNSFWDANKISVRTPPPHKFAVNQFEKAFQKLSPNCTKALSFVLATYVYTESKSREKIRVILKTVCLDYLEYYGMGCLYWLEKACEELSLGPDTLIDSLGTSDNRVISQALRNIWNNYIHPDRKEYTWPWARLFMDQAFIEISTSKNPKYAATMAALSCRGDGKNPLWNISQFRDETLKNEAIEMAKYVLLRLKKNVKKS